MKIHDFAYRVAMRTMQLLEEKQHYKISEENRKEIGAQVLREVDTFIEESK